MLKKVLCTAAALVCCLVIAAILYPMFAQAERYSGPGYIEEALLIGLDGQPVRNREILLGRRGGGGITLTTYSDSLGEIHVPKKSKVDAMQGFQRRGVTQQGPDGKVHPIFWEIDPATREVTAYQYQTRPAEDLTANWPTPEHPTVKIWSVPWSHRHPMAAAKSQVRR